MAQRPGPAGDTKETTKCCDLDHPAEAGTMSRVRGSQVFKQRDIERAMKAVRKAGCTIASVKIKPDEIEIITTDAPGARAEDDNGGDNPWDSV